MYWISLSWKQFWSKCKSFIWKLTLGSRRVRPGEIKEKEKQVQRWINKTLWQSGYSFTRNCKMYINIFFRSACWQGIPNSINQFIQLLGEDCTLKYIFAEFLNCMLSDLFISEKPWCVMLQDSLHQPWNMMNKKNLRLFRTFYETVRLSQVDWELVKNV